MLLSGRVLLKNSISRAACSRKSALPLLHNVNNNKQKIPKDSTVIFRFGCRCFCNFFARSTSATSRAHIAGYAERSWSKFETLRRLLLSINGRALLLGRRTANENALLRLGISTCISVGVVCSSIAFCYSGSKSKNKLKPIKVQCFLK